MGVLTDILKWIWQLPQHIAALVFFLYVRVAGKVVSTEKGDPFIIKVRGVGGSVTLGKYIFLSYSASENTKKHEVGHTKQSLMLGPLYLIIVGIPSILWASCHKWIAPGKTYHSFWCEKWANRLGGVN